MAKAGGPLLRAAIFVLALAAGGAAFAADSAQAPGWNPFPVRLQRPPAAPLSMMAELGRRIFHDASLSGSGKQSCASCHDPANHYGPDGAAPVALGGPGGRDQGFRAVPSLAYLERQPVFSVGPEADEDEGTTLAQMVARSGGARAAKTARNTAQSAGDVVPQGGLFWDGRADTLQQQAMGPLLNPVEMANPSVASVAAKLRAAYAPGFTQLFGPGVLDNAALLVGEAMFAVARYQIEDASFHPYTSKFDYWLEGRTRFSPAEMRGYLLFNDPARANCGGCHVDQPGRDGLPPRFTDGQFEALGAPRNPALRINRDPKFFDRGICGPYRTDMRADTRFCGMFATPTLRNVATRRVFFHNGVFHSLRAVLDFYNDRDVAPGKVYPRAADGSIAKYDDMPPADRANVDTIDPPFDRHPGQAPAMSAQDEADIIAFLDTLTDGFAPER
ncbi:MAG: cytochrome-c peroxidase [Rhodospirillales bacterium 70-18]|nr:MAG: cytochrome-c peroxidase [Rhodospirillales bacterium 70-18]